MMYDITFCSDDYCARHATCHRWLQYQRYKRDRSSTKRTLIAMTAGAPDCRLYWAEKE